MTERHTTGSFSINAPVTGSAIAVGQGASASAVNEAGSSADLAGIQRELAELRAALAAMRSDPAAAPVGGDDLDEAARTVDELDHELHQKSPDRAKVTERISTLTTLLAGVAGMVEVLERLGHAASQVLH